MMNQSCRMSYMSSSLLWCEKRIGSLPNVRLPLKLTRSCPLGQGSIQPARKCRRRFSQLSGQWIKYPPYPTGCCSCRVSVNSEKRNHWIFPSNSLVHKGMNSISRYQYRRLEANISNHDTTLNDNTPRNRFQGSFPGWSSAWNAKTPTGKLSWWKTRGSLQAPSLDPKNLLAAHVRPWCTFRNRLFIRLDY